MTIHWQSKPFAELLPLEVYKILQLRSEVFVVDQNEIYLDADDKDLDAIHIAGWNETNRLIAYARIVWPTASDKFVRFGRVLVAPAARGHGYGHQLIEQLFACIAASPYKSSPIEIFAQTYLEKMYHQYQFSTCSEPFDIGHTSHIMMQRVPLG